MTLRPWSTYHGHSESWQQHPSVLRLKGPRVHSHPPGLGQAVTLESPSPGEQNYEKRAERIGSPCEGLTSAWLRGLFPRLPICVDDTGCIRCCAFSKLNPKGCNDGGRGGRACVPSSPRLPLACCLFLALVTRDSYAEKMP